MNNIVNMVNYYITHKNADDSVIDYIKSKIDKSNIEDLILIEIRLLYIDPSDELVSSLVYYINSKINDILVNISLNELISLISLLQSKVSDINSEIDELTKENKETFKKIKEKDLNNDNLVDDNDSQIAGNLIDKSKSNEFYINELKSEISSINIWLKNLENSLNKTIAKSDIETMIESYVNEISNINRDKFINSFINKTANKIDKILLETNLLETITDIIPRLNKMYDNNYNKNNRVYKLLDYYIDLVDNNVKQRINNLEYSEKLVLKDKINAICYEILHNDDKYDDFKVLIISNYLRYL